jgi:hypothetical protein
MAAVGYSESSHGKLATDDSNATTYALASMVCTNVEADDAVLSDEFYDEVADTAASAGVMYADSKAENANSQDEEYDEVMNSAV